MRTSQLNVRVPHQVREMVDHLAALIHSAPCVIVIGALWPTLAGVGHQTEAEVRETAHALWLRAIQAQTLCESEDRGDEVLSVPGRREQEPLLYPKGEE